MVYVLLAALALVIFLILLNRYLLGGWKTQIYVGLTVAAALLLALTYWTQGHNVTIAAVIIALVVYVLGRPLAARSATAIMAGGRDSISPFHGLPSRTLLKISRELAEATDLESIALNFARGVDPVAPALDQFFAYCRAQPPLLSVMQEFAIGRSALGEIYDQLLRLGAGQWCAAHWVPASAFAYPDVLRYVAMEHASGQLNQNAAYRLVVHFERRAPLETGAPALHA